MKFGIDLVDDAANPRRVDSIFYSHQPHTQKWTTHRGVDDFIELLPAPHIQQKVFDKFFADTNPYLMFLSQGLVEDISACLNEPSIPDLSTLPLPHASTNHRKKERAALLLFTVLATGASHVDQPIKGLDPADRYKLIAMELLAQLGDHLTLECVQALLLMTWKEEGCNHSEQAWLHLGISTISFLADSKVMQSELHITSVSIVRAKLGRFSTTRKEESEISVGGGVLLPKVWYHFVSVDLQQSTKMISM